MSYIVRSKWSCLARTTTKWPISSSQRRLLSVDSRYVQISEEVKQAIAEKRPVVALESTIYTHGFPFPENVALASSLETMVRSGNAVPATIGVIDGIAKVGFNDTELVRLASCSQNQDNLLKISRRDLAYALSKTSSNGQKYCGGTTVSGTMVLAHLAGIKVFATGGLGGVHRGASETFDISADLTELGRTPVAVIASGCKAFLDIPKTLEYLETQGCSVATFADGRHGDVDFPGFWSRDSGSKSPMVVSNEIEAAQMIYAQHSLGMSSGLLFGNPIPEQHEIPLAEMQTAIDQALREALDAGATGNRATPFILAKMKELTGSRSVKANTMLVQNNVKRGVNIAVELSKIERGETESASSEVSKQVVSSTNEDKPQTSNAPFAKLETPLTTKETTIEQDVDVFVAGMVAVDFSCNYQPRESAPERDLELQTSNPAKITQSLGGVGHNIARAAQLSGAQVAFASVVGEDMNATAVMTALSDENLTSDCIHVLPASSNRRTAQYVAVNDKSKDLVVAMADMSILDWHSSDPLAEAFTQKWLPQLQQHRPSYVAIDGNWPPEYLARWLKAAKDIKAFTIFEPVSTTKSTIIFHSSLRQDLGVFPESSVHLATPNEHELSSMYQAARDAGLFERADWWKVIDSFGIPSSGARMQLVLATSNDLVDSGVPQKALQLLPYFSCLTVKLGSQGVLVVQILSKDDARLTSAGHAPYILSRSKERTS
ncbi:hypothetical protein MRB53_039924 [Persea americana]|nr:hypothetical protein MRB53_039924 [Persea americana]